VSAPSENQETREDEKLMELLSEHSHAAPKLSPMFSQDVMREIRLQDAKAANPLQSAWHWLFGHPVFAANSVIAVAVAVIVCVSVWDSISQPESLETSSFQTGEIATVPAANAELFSAEEEAGYDAFANDLLSMAAEDEGLLSDGQVLALLF